MKATIHGSGLPMTGLQKGEAIEIFYPYKCLEPMTAVVDLRPLGNRHVFVPMMCRQHRSFRP